MANTKLTADQKAALKAFREHTAHVKCKHNGETTIAYHERGRTVEFALSVASLDEKKFRPKVGEFYARNRFYSGETVKMKTQDFYYMMEVLFYIYI